MGMTLTFDPTAPVKSNKMRQSTRQVRILRRGYRFLVGSMRSLVSYVRPWRYEWAFERVALPTWWPTSGGDDYGGGGEDDM